jgi:hypothetical protein
MAHLGAARSQQFLRDVGIVGRTEQGHHVKTEGRRADRQQLEIAGMRGEDDARVFLVRRSLKKVSAPWTSISPGSVGIRVKVEQLVEIDVFGGEAGHVAPHADWRSAPFFLGFSGKAWRKIVQRQLVARERDRASGHEIDEARSPCVAGRSEMKPSNPKVAARSASPGAA